MKDKNKKYNYYGEELSDGSQRVSDIAYLDTSSENSDGNQWAIYKKEFFQEDHDDDGFAKTVPIEDYIIPKGNIIVRFGMDGGRFSAPDKTKFEKVALPYRIETLEYHRYLVKKDLPVKCLKNFSHHVFSESDGKKRENVFFQEDNTDRLVCLVRKGKVAAAFNQIGGGIQYCHYASIKRLVINNVLEELFEENQYGIK